MDNWRDDVIQLCSLVALSSVASRNLVFPEAATAKCQANVFTATGTPPHMDQVKICRLYILLIIVLALVNVDKFSVHIVGR